MVIRIYPSSQMGNARETMELLQNGALDMTKGSASDLESFDNIYAIYNLPFLFKDQAHFNKVVLVKLVKKLWTQQKTKVFCFISLCSGYTQFLCEKPITKPEDLKGLKIRVQPSPTTIKMIELMGGSPTNFIWRSLYCDAARCSRWRENNVPSRVQTRHIEIAKVFSEDEHASIPDFWLSPPKHGIN